MAKRTDLSGDILADRRFGYGQALAAEGDHDAAADLFTQTLERAPDWAPGWFALGEARVRLGARDDAVAAFSKVTTLDPHGLLGASLALAALGAIPVPEGADPEHVRALFDDYAPRFDAHLTGTLGYRAPALLRELLDGAGSDRRWRRAFDLGCGTGLMGEAVRPITDWLGGVDLSPEMVERARAKSVYDQLEVGEMLSALRAESMALDLILAADVFVYLGDLGPIFRAVAAAATPDALLAFTVQRGSDGTGVQVGADRRFTHSTDHLRLRAAEAGFKFLRCEDVATRRDAGVNVPGLIVLMSK